MVYQWAAVLHLNLATWRFKRCWTDAKHILPGLRKIPLGPEKRRKAHVDNPTFCQMTAAFNLTAHMASGDVMRSAPELDWAVFKMNMTAWETTLQMLYYMFKAEQGTNVWIRRRLWKSISFPLERYCDRRLLDFIPDSLCKTNLFLEHFGWYDPSIL